MREQLHSTATRLNDFLFAAGLEVLDPQASERFAEYCALLLHWNARTNLTAIRDKDGILSRHFVESIACARALPGGIGTLLDFGSGAGFPGVPVALCRPEISVTLAESQGKKSAFLREVVRTLDLSSTVHAARAEELSARFDCVTLRAVDRMEQAVPAASALLAPGGWLAVMTTEAELDRLKALLGESVSWRQPQPLAGSCRGFLALGQKALSR